MWDTCMVHAVVYQTLLDHSTPKTENVVLISYTHGTTVEMFTTLYNESTDGSG